MKKATLILLAPLLLFSCKKDAGGSTTPVKPKIDNTKLGETIKAVVTTQDVGQWNFSATEYDANTNAGVLHIDTTLRGNFTYEFVPHVNNTVLLTVTIGGSSPPNLDFKGYDGTTEENNFLGGQDFLSLSFTAK
jgi:hypothetical protein